MKNILKRAATRQCLETYFKKYFQAPAHIEFAVEKSMKYFDVSEKRAGGKEAPAVLIAKECAEFYQRA